MIIQIISQNLKNSKLISLYSIVLFIFKCFSWWTTSPVAWKSIAKVLNQKVARQPNGFLSSSFFRWASSFLCDSFAMVLHKTAAFYTKQCTISSLFHSFEVSWDAPELVTEELWLHVRCDFFTCTHVHKSLSNEMKLLHKCVWRVWTEPGLINDFTLILHIATEEALEDRLADGNSMHLLKKWHKQG